MTRFAVLAAALALVISSGVKAEEREQAGEGTGEGIVIIQGGQGGWVGGGQIQVVGEGGGAQGVQLQQQPALQPLGGNPGAAIGNPQQGAQGNIKSAADADAYMFQWNKIVTFTDEQKKSITEIIEKRDKEIAEFKAKNADKIKEVQQELNDAFKSGDKEAVAQAVKDYQAMYGPMNKITADAASALKKLYTDDQNFAIADFQATNYITMMTKPVKLTEDQMKKLKAAYHDGVKKDGRGDKALFEILSDTLTAKQRAEINTTWAMSYVNMRFAGAKLTPEQLKKAQEIAADLTKDSKLQQLDRQALTDQVMALLTEDQKLQVNTNQAWGFGARNGGGNAAPR